MIVQLRDRWLTLIIVTNIGFWFANGIHEWFVRGLFQVPGVDWARFWAASLAFRHAGSAAAYKLPAIAHYMQPILEYYRPEDARVRVGPAPYPPIFLRLFEFLTLPPAPIGYLIWTGLSIGLAAHVFHRLGDRFPTTCRWKFTLLMLSAFPLMMAFYVGQVVALLLVCVMQAMLDFERGRDFRAGMWIGLMILKPQYAVCIMLVLLAKRRWSAIGGATVGGAIILGSSLLVGGVGGLVAYARMLVTDYPSYAGSVAIDPRGMIGWRSLVITVFPDFSTTSSLVLVALLSLATVALLPGIWAGRWDPTSPRFARQMVLTFAITLMVAYHSQPHGAALLLVPCAMLLAQPDASPLARRLLIGSLAITPIVGTISALVMGNLWLVSLMTSGVLIALIVILVRPNEPLPETRSVQRPRPRGFRPVPG